MKKASLKKAFTFILISMTISSFPCLFVNNIESLNPFFTIKVLTSVWGTRPDYVNLISQQLERIGIDSEIELYGYFLGDSLFIYEYDLALVGLSGGGGDPDSTGLYNEKGSLNIFNYHTSIDYNATLGTGINEWYIDEGLNIMPPNGQERIAHYWAWEQYLMDELCLMYPLTTPKSYMAFWEPLVGYNMTEGLLRSWGKMSWNGTHEGQVNTNEVVISDPTWSDLNPLFQYDTYSSFISSATMDKLIIYDPDLTVYPHLAQNLTYLSDNHIRITTRDGIKWQTDPDGLFTNEYFDAEDVYFTIYSWMEISNDIYDWYWIDDLVLVDEKTVDIYIDGNPSTPEKEPYAKSLNELFTIILPEHYLNQTQLTDNVTPDFTHSSWNTFATHCFGTGLFTIDHFEEGKETILAINPDCWYFNESITNDPLLNWNTRYGNFSSSPEQLRIRIMPTLQEPLEEFKLGNLDLVSVTHFPVFRRENNENSKWKIQSDIFNSIIFLAFNIDSENEIIGCLEPCENDNSTTKGLAVRKAICYAINRDEINNIVHGGDYQIINHPIYPKLGVWCNPNIIKYDYDLEKAKHYMNLAGYNIPDHIYSNQIFSDNLWVYILVGISYFIGIVLLFFGIVLIRKKIRRKRGKSQRNA